MRKLIVPALAALAAAGAIAAVGIARSGDAVPAGAALAGEAGYGPSATTLHRVAAPSPLARTAGLPRGTRQAGGVRIVYLETVPGNVPPDGQGAGEKLPCPRGHRVLGGYFGSDGVDIALTFSAPVSKRKWFVGITNLSGDYQAPSGVLGSGNATEALLGIVCAQGVK